MKKNEMSQGKYFFNDFHCLFCRYWRNKNLSIVMLSQKNFIRQNNNCRQQFGNK